MSEALAIGAVGTWGIGAVAAAVAIRLWLRAARRWLGLLGLAGVLAVELAELVWIAARGVDVLLAPQEGFVDRWIGWTAGIAGVVALASGLAGTRGERHPDRAAEVAVGLFGLGILLRQLASIV